MSSSSTLIGWDATHPVIMDVAAAARAAPSFDLAQRTQDVEDAVRQAGRFSVWPLLLLFPAALLPDAGVWVSLSALGWFVYVITARLRAVECRARMVAETEAIQAQVAADACAHADLLDAADRGGLDAMQALLGRWMERRPECLRTFDVGLVRGTNSMWILTGSAVAREAVPSVVSVLSHRNRVVARNRKEREIDADLTELNASAVSSVLVALFSGRAPVPVSVRVTMKRPNGSGADPWVRLERSLSAADIAKLRAARQPSAALEELGGGVGRVHARHVTPAPVPAPAAADSGRYVPLGTRPDAAPAQTLRTVQPGAVIPPRPAGSATRPPDDAPSLRTMPTDFERAARQYAAYAGEPDVPFVPFTHYWPTYQSMRADQLRYYFSWRGAFRALALNEGAPPTDASYLYTHAYELLLLAGVADPLDAIRQLERLWVSYRPTVPSLDVHLVTWIGDLHAMHVSPGAASDWLLRAVGHGAAVREDVLRLVLDRYWAAGDFRGMPVRCLHLLTGDQTRSTNRFYELHNADGWVVGGLRVAMAAADRAHLAATGQSVRDDERPTFIALAHQAFPGARILQERVIVQWGLIPALLPSSRAVRFYRVAARYAENQMRKARGSVTLGKFATVDPHIAQAIDAAVAAYIESTRVKPQVVINLARAAALAEESVEVRARLLVGLESNGSDAPAPSPPPLSRVDGPGAVPTADSGRGPELPSEHTVSASPGVADTVDGFNPTELAALALLLATPVDGPTVSALATAAGTTVLQLVDALNERGLDSPFGDLLVEPDSMPPALLPDAVPYVTQVLAGAVRA